jgi:hypothetical protein
MDDPDSDTLRRHGLDVVPPAAQASPIRYDDDPGDVPFWTPTWRDSARSFGWRWIFAVPAILCLGIVLASLFWGRYFLPVWMIGVKLLVVLLAIPVLVLLEMWRKIISTREEAFCIHCGYLLQGLPDHHRCPECGRAYSFAVINEYRRDPHWFKQRYKMLGRLPEADEPFHAGSGRTTHDGT